MATYDEVPYNGVPLHRNAVGPQIYRGAVRTFATGDIVRLWKIERDVKVVDCLVGASVSLGAAAPVTVRLNDGTTQVNLITVAQLATANLITRLNVSAGLGYVVPTRGFWLEVLFGTVTTATPGSVIVGMVTSGAMIGVESPLQPTGVG